MGFAAPVGLSLALFVEVLAWIITACLLVVWEQTFGAAFRYVAGLLTFRVRTHVGYSKTFHLGQPFRDADTAISTWLKAERDGLSIEIGWTWHALQETWQATASAVEWLTHETADTLEWIEGVKLPRWAKWAATAALPAALLTKLIAAAVAHLRPELIREIKVVEHAIPAKAITIVRKAAPLALPIPLGLPAIRSEIYGLTRRNLRLAKRLRRVESLFGVAAMAAVMANVLGLPNWRCLTRGNIGRAARHFCGLEKWIVDLFLLGSVEAFIVTDLCAFSNLLIRQAELIRPALMELVDVEDALIDCGGTSKPMLFKLPPASLPPLQGVSPLAA